jgi:hypothetical protein
MIVVKSHRRTSSQGRVFSVVRHKRTGKQKERRESRASIALRMGIGAAALGAAYGGYNYLNKKKLLTSANFTPSPSSSQKAIAKAIGSDNIGSASAEKVISQANKQAQKQKIKSIVSNLSPIKKGVNNPTPAGMYANNLAAKLRNSRSGAANALKQGGGTKIQKAQALSPTRVNAGNTVTSSVMPEAPKISPPSAKISSSQAEKILKAQSSGGVSKPVTKAAVPKHTKRDGSNLVATHRKQNPAISKAPIANSKKTPNYTSAKMNPTSPVPAAKKAGNKQKKTTAGDKTGLSGAKRGQKKIKFKNE